MFPDQCEFPGERKGMGKWIEMIYIYICCMNVGVERGMPRCSRNREKVKIAVYKFAKILRRQITTSRNKDIVIGPFPCYPELVDNKYHWEIFLKGKDPSIHIRRMKIPRGWHIQVDA